MPKTLVERSFSAHIVCTHDFTVEIVQQLNLTFENVSRKAYAQIDLDIGFELPFYVTWGTTLDMLLKTSFISHNFDMC